MTTRGALEAFRELVAATDLNLFATMTARRSSS
jgi:hypothetical protein